MKKIILVLALIPLLSANYKLAAQLWKNGGNNLSATGRLGTTSNQSLAFITSNTERGRITNTGNWGIGTNNPSAKLAINSGAGASPLSVLVNGSTKLLVHSTGGVAIGANDETPPTNGLYVSGNVGIGPYTGSSSPSSTKLQVVNHNGWGIYGEGSTGIYGEGTNYGVQGYGSYAGVYGHGDSWGTSGPSYGVYGDSYVGTGVFGESLDGTGAKGFSDYGVGVSGSSFDSTGGYFESYNRNALVARTTNGSFAGVFYGSVYASDGYLTSDKNLKTNLEDVGNAMSIINKLKPKNYEFKNEAKYASLKLPKGRHYGLLAQDVKEVLPNLVSEAPHELKTVKARVAREPTADGKPAPVVTEQKGTSETINIQAVNYVELIPIIVRAMQEQEATIEKQNVTIEKQNGKIEALTHLVNELKNSNSQTSVKLSGGSLGQNSPNPPIANSTRIRYNIPSGSTRAELVFTTVAGQKVKQMQLNRNGARVIDLDTSIFSAGTYFYTLYVDGKSVETKKMIVNR